MKKHPCISAMLFVMALLVSFEAFCADEFSGELFWSKRVQLSLPVSGVVKSVPVKVGDYVKKGQVLITLRLSHFQADVSDAQANLAKRKQAFQEAEKELERAKELYKRTVLSNTELDQKQTAYVTAQAELDRAKALLRKRRVDRDFASLKAPFAGIIAGRNVEEGQTIVSRLQAEPLIVLVQHNPMVARIPVPADRLELFAVGKSTMVKLGKKDIFPGKVVVVGLEPLRKEGGTFYEVDVEFNPKNKLLRAGRSVTVVMP